MYKRKCLFTSMFTFLHSFCILRRWKKCGKTILIHHVHIIPYHTLLILQNELFLCWFWIQNHDVLESTLSFSVGFVVFCLLFMRDVREGVLHVSTYLKSFFFLRFFPGSSESEPSHCSCLRLAYFFYHQWAHILVIWCLLLY